MERGISGFATLDKWCESVRETDQRFSTMRERINQGALVSDDMVTKRGGTVGRVSGVCRSGWRRQA